VDRFGGGGLRALIGRDRGGRWYELAQALRRVE